LPTCGLIISAACVSAVGVLEIAGVGTNRIPIKTETNKIEVSFASLRVILFLLHAD